MSVSNAVRPVSRVFKKYTFHYCGACLHRVYLKDRKCRSCGVKIKWEK